MKETEEIVKAAQEKYSFGYSCPRKAFSNSNNFEKKSIFSFNFPDIGIPLALILFFVFVLVYLDKIHLWYYFVIPGILSFMFGRSVNR